MRIVYTGPDLSAVADLAVAMQRAGHEVAALLPYDAAAEGRTRATRVRFPVSVGPQTITAEILQATGPEKLSCYLFRASEELPIDSAARGVFCSQVAVEVARRLIPSPALLHLVGWETALAPSYVRFANLPFRTVFELHDLEQQGSFDGGQFGITRLPAGFFTPGAVEFFGRLNFLKGGLLLAHALVVDSWSTYTALRTEPAAHGLGVVLAEQGAKCTAIRRPGQIAGWDPEVDEFIKKHFSADTLGGKSACRAELLKTTGTKRKCAGPVVLMECGAETSLSAERIAVLDRWLSPDGKLIVITRDEFVPALLEAAALRSPAHISLLRETDEKTRHLAVAGADFQFFPDAPTVAFADTAWRAMRYGTIPIARDHIGCREIFDEQEGLAWFIDSAEAVWDTVAVRAGALFRAKEALDATRERAMRRAALVTEETITAAHAELYRSLGAAQV